MKFLIKCFKIFMNFIYNIFKLFKTKNKITFISRQSDKTSIDFFMLSEEIKRQEQNVRIVILNKRIGDNIMAKILYFCHMFTQMYHIATSKVIILDGYCIAISILNHKRDLKVIQLWHALGSLKKFGYSTLDKKDGRGKEISELMNMHKNYSYVLTSSKISKTFFEEAFNVEEDKMIVMSLPRVDFLKSEYYKIQIKNKFYEIYNEALNKKTNILYSPTLRKNKKIDINKIISATDFKKNNLIIKLHDVQGGMECVYVDNKKLDRGNNFTGMDLLHVADYVITDYSAIVYEAAIMQKPLFFYTFDFKDYVNDRGWYIDYINEMPGPICESINDIMKKINKNDYDIKKVIDFANKYVDDLSENVTNKLAKFILDIKKGEHYNEL